MNLRGLKMNKCKIFVIVLSIFIVSLFSIIAFAAEKQNLEQKFSIPKSDEERILEAGTFCGKAMNANLNWKEYYVNFMEVERKKDWVDEQIAYIGVLFGAVQGNVKKNLYSLEDKKKLELELQNRISKLKTIKFSDTANLYTDILWYDLGENDKNTSIIIYPINSPYKSTLIIKFINNIVIEVDVINFKSNVINKSFSTLEWSKANSENRAEMAKDIINKNILKGRNKETVISILGKSDGTYYRKYGYKIIRE
jgi:hypothetical protein